MPAHGPYGGGPHAANRRSRMGAQRSFSKNPPPTVPRSVFNRSSGLHTAFDHGMLVPIYLDEMLPGDTVSMRCTPLVRLATPTFPIMDRLWVETFWFFVPYRLTWVNFQKFMGEEDDPGDNNTFNMPRMDYGAGTVALESLSDYFGLPLGKSMDNDMVNAMPFRSYNLIFKEWFRDQDLTDSPVVDTDDGPDAIADYVLRKRSKRHDYFTACRPWLQKNDDGAVTLPLGTVAPVISAGTGIPLFDIGVETGHPLEAADGSSNTHARWPTAGGQVGGDDASWNTTSLTADLTSATAATINQLREAFQVQKLYERDARGGTRYTEIVRSHFGVVSSDQRLNRPEFCGSTSTQINVVPVPNMATIAEPTGVLAAYGIGVGTGRAFTKSFTEHGYLIGLCATRADLSYQQGLDRIWSRQSRVDHYWPAFAHLGEQSILNKEIFYNDDANDNLVFGYQERYAEYRHKQSKITGIMRSDAAGTLNAWHGSIDFSVLPSLNDAFIQEDATPIERMLATPGESHYVANFWFDCRHVRPMPTYSVPGMADHF